MVMALATSLEKLKIAQAELDSVIGPTRAVTLLDRHRLPYIQAIVKETLRWHPPLPMDIARSSIQDDNYRGRPLHCIKCFVFTCSFRIFHS